MANINPSECKVALLAGGTSGEREISLSSGRAAKLALEEAGFTVDMIDPAERAGIKQLIDGDYDVAFLTMHGKQGEDGTLQGLLEIIGLPYTGSGVLASALAMDKAKAKVIYKENGIATPPSIVLCAGDKYSVEGIIDEIGEHCVVKPATEGSALGVQIVEGEKAIEQAIANAFEIDSEVIVEKYVHGMEVTVAVLGNDDIHALPPIEIVPMNDFYDFDSKYLPGGAQHICPARIGEQMTALVKKRAEQAHKALGCRGVSRSDLIIDEEGEPWVLETNTIPGMTATSLLPDAARVDGLEFPQLCAKLVELALE